MDRAEAIKMVRSIWVAKAEASKAKEQLLPDYLHSCMYKKLGKPSLVAEAIYSLLYTCMQHAYDPELRLFLQVGASYLLAAGPSLLGPSLLPHPLQPF